jgi:hypothetical protein
MARDVKQIEIQTAGPLAPDPRVSELETVIAKLNR